MNNIQNDVLISVLYEAIHVHMCTCMNKRFGMKTYDYNMNRD